VPPEAILAAAGLAEALAGSDWAAILRQVCSQREVAFPAGELLGRARAYRDGRLTLEDLGRQLRGRGLQPVPPVCPPGLEEAKAALDDLEPWAAGSFEEIVVACDLGILTDDDYAALVAAVASWRADPAAPPENARWLSPAICCGTAGMQVVGAACR
jgi:hypothetical protein